MLLSEIRDEIINEVGGDVADTSLQNKIFGFMKSALRRFPLHTRSRLLIGTSTIALSTGENNKDLPTDFISELIIYRISSGSRINIEKPPSFSAVVNTVSSGVPLYYEIQGNKIFFDKNADQVYTIYIEHFKEIDTVIAGDTWAYSSPMIEVLKDGTKYTYYSDYAEDPVKGREKLTLFVNGLDTIEEKFMIETGGTHITES